MDSIKRKVINNMNCIKYSVFFIILQVIIITLTLFALRENKFKSNIKELRQTEERICQEGYFYSSETNKCFKKADLKVLLIKDKKAGNKVYDLLKALPFVSKIVVNHPYAVPKYELDYLSLFDVVLYDTFDSGFYINLTNKKVIETYIKNGGSFLVTHDRWDEDYGPLELLDCEREKRNYVESLTRKAKVSEFNHPFFDTYYDLTNWKVIEIAETHKTYHKIIDRGTNTVKVLMELVVEKERGIKYDYLLTNEVGKGRIMYWAAGHSNTISEDEEKLFMNIFCWLGKIEHQ